MLSTFTLDQTIAIVAGEAYYDLHNCFDFVGFEYRSSEKKARLEWQRGAGDWVSQELPKKLVLCFSGVVNITVQRRNDEMPFTEDSCLESITFLPPALSDNFGAVCSGGRFDDEHLSIEFRSGSGVKIWADSVTHEIEPA